MRSDGSPLLSASQAHPAIPDLSEYPMPHKLRGLLRYLSDLRKVLHLRSEGYLTVHLLYLQLLFLPLPALTDSTGQSRHSASLPELRLPCPAVPLSKSCSGHTPRKALLHPPASHLLPPAVQSALLLPAELLRRPEAPP